MSIYTLLEVNDCGLRSREDFPAPDDLTAIARALEAVEGEDMEIFQGERQVFRSARQNIDKREAALALA